MSIECVPGGHSCRWPKRCLKMLWYGSLLRGSRRVPVDGISMIFSLTPMVQTIHSIECHIEDTTPADTSLPRREDAP